MGRNHSAVCIHLPAIGACTRHEEDAYNIGPTLERDLMHGYCRRRSASLIGPSFRLHKKITDKPPYMSMPLMLCNGSAVIRDDTHW